MHLGVTDVTDVLGVTGVADVIGCKNVTDVIEGNGCDGRDWV